MIFIVYFSRSNNTSIQVLIRSNIIAEHPILYSLAGSIQINKHYDTKILSPPNCQRVLGTGWLGCLDICEENRCRCKHK